MGFIMDGLAADAYDRQYSDRQLTTRIGTYFRPQARRMALVGGLIALTSLADTVLPILVSLGIDNLARTHAVETTIMLVGAILVAGALSWIFNFFRQSITARVVGDVVLKLRKDAFAAVLARDL